MAAKRAVFLLGDGELGATPITTMELIEDHTVDGGFTREYWDK